MNFIDNNYDDNNDDNNNNLILQISRSDVIQKQEIHNNIKITFNTQTNKYLLVTNDSIITFDKIIGYYFNTDTHHNINQTTLLLINYNNIISFDLDENFKNSQLLIQELNKLIIRTNLNYTSDQIIIQHGQCNANFKHGDYQIIHYQNQHKILFKFTTGTFIADHIIAFHHNHNTSPTITATYNNISFQYHIDTLYSFQINLFDGIHHIISTFI